LASSVAALAASADAPGAGADAASEDAGAAGAAGAAADGSGAGAAAAAGAGAAGGATTAGASSFFPQAVSAAAAISDPSNKDFFITWLLWMKVSKILDLTPRRNMSQDVFAALAYKPSVDAGKPGFA
jgi:hypothetical protein